MTDGRPSFGSIDEHFIEGRGTVFIVENAEDTNDFKYLYPTVVIDGREWEVRGVERFAHMPPYRKGERIGILVRETKNNNEEKDGTMTNFKEMEENERMSQEKQMETRIKSICGRRGSPFTCRIDRDDDAWVVSTPLRKMFVNVTVKEVVVRFEAVKKLGYMETAGGNGYHHSLTVVPERVISKEYGKAPSLVLASMEDKIVAIAEEDAIRSLEMWESHGDVKRVPGGTLVRMGDSAPAFVQVPNEYFVVKEDVVDKN